MPLKVTVKPNIGEERTFAFGDNKEEPILKLLEALLKFD